MQDYRIIVNEAIMKKITALKNKDYGTFFQYDSNFMLALGLSYMVLSEEEIIIKDIANTLNLTGTLSEQEYHNILKIYFKPAPIIYQCTNPTNYIGLIKAIRDSIMHNTFSVDVENKVFHINNQVSPEKLICDVSFSWFEKFSKLNLNTMKAKAVYQHIELLPTSFLLNYKCANKKINTEEELNDFLSNIVLYKVDVNFKETFYEFEKVLKYACGACNEDLEELPNIVGVEPKALLEYINTTLRNKLKDCNVSYEKLELSFASNDFLFNIKSEDIKYILEECNSINEQIAYLKNLISQKNNSINESVLQIPHDLEKRFFQMQNISQNEFDRNITDVVFEGLSNNLDTEEILDSIHKLRTDYNFRHTYSNKYTSYNCKNEISDEDIQAFEIRVFMFRAISPLFNSPFLHLMLLYALGINSFVIFKNNDMNYDDILQYIDDLNVYCAYTQAIKDKEKFLKRNRNSLSNQEILALLEELSQYDKSDKLIVSESEFIKCTGNAALNVLRNSFSHLGRVTYDDFENGIVRLEDYRTIRRRQTQELSGFVLCENEKLLSLFNALAVSPEDIKKHI